MPKTKQTSILNSTADKSPSSISKNTVKDLDIKMCFPESMPFYDN